MSTGELLIRILAELKPLLPGVIAAILATVAAMLLLYRSSSHAWLESSRFPLVGLFFGLDYWGIVCLACAWLKLIFPIVYVISFQKLELIQYLMVLIPGLVLVVLSGSAAAGLAALVNLALELAGIVNASLVCGYITDMRAGAGFMLVYAAISVFLVLFALYLFIQDLERISAARSVNPKEVWRTGAHEEKE